jgi:hypothetical protein
MFELYTYITSITYDYSTIFTYFLRGSGKPTAQAKRYCLRAAGELRGTGAGSPLHKD